jgi:ribosome recycling factor
VRIPIPALTEERRKELSRHVHKQAEEGRNACARYAATPTSDSRSC